MEPGQILFLLLPVVVVALLFRSQRRRQGQARQMQEQIHPGAEVCLTSGLFGTVVSIDPKVVVIEPAPGLNLRFDRRAIALVVPSEEPDAPPEPVESGPDGTP